MQVIKYVTTVARIPSHLIRTFIGVTILRNSSLSLVKEPLLSWMSSIPGISIPTTTVITVNLSHRPSMLKTSMRSVPSLPIHCSFVDPNATQDSTIIIDGLTKVSLLFLQSSIMELIFTPSSELASPWLACLLGHRSKESSHCPISVR